MRYLTHNACLRCASLGLGCCSRCHPFVLFADLALLLRYYSSREVTEIVEVSEILSKYIEHLSDPEMAQIYYPRNGSYYRMQTKFVGDSCIALKPGKGCVLGNNRPLICRVWPFWWKEGTQPLTEKFPMEIDEECIMAVWKFPMERVLEELNLSEDQIRKELTSMSRALNEHEKILGEVKKENIPATELLKWFINKTK